MHGLLLGVRQRSSLVLHSLSSLPSSTASHAGVTETRRTPRRHEKKGESTTRGNRVVRWRLPVFRASGFVFAQSRDRPPKSLHTRLAVPGRGPHSALPVHGIRSSGARRARPETGPSVLTWRQPALPCHTTQYHRRNRLYFRVRNGIGCFPVAMITRNFHLLYPLR